jgi:hypothetical protein
MDVRAAKARVIVAGGRVTWVNGVYYVPSQSGGARYRVTVDGLFPTCSCEDHELTGGECKHIIAAKLWRDEQRNNPRPRPVSRSEMPVLPPRKAYPQDWPNYDRAQTNEKDHFQHLLADLCRAIPEPAPKGGSKGGRPAVPLCDAAFASVFRVYCGFSARRFVCDVRDAAGRGHMLRPIGYSAVAKAMESEALTPVLHDLIRRSAAPLREVESDFAVDSSGFCTNTYTRWFDVKYGAREQQTWVKAHIATGVTTNVVAAVEIHGQHTGDCNILPSLTETTARTFTIREVSADKAYTATANFEAVAEHGGTLYAAFKSNTTGWVGGIYEKMWHVFCANREDYLRHYHKRSNVESTFSAVKRKFGEAVRSKTETAQKNEVLCKFVCQNVCCLIHAAYELGLDVPGWRDAEDETRIIRFPGVG